MIDTAREVIATCAVFAPLATGFSLWARAMQSSALARRYHGNVSFTGGCVRFDHAGYSVQLERSVADSLGLNSCPVSTLTIWLEEGSPLMMGPFDTMNALLAKSEPFTSSSVFTGDFSVMLVGESHSNLVDQCFREKCIPLLGEVFTDTASGAVVRIVQRVRLSWRRPPRRQWALSLSGVPDIVYQDPKVLASILSNLKRLGEIAARTWQGRKAPAQS